MARHAVSQVIAIPEQGVRYDSADFPQFPQGFGVDSCNVYFRDGNYRSRSGLNYISAAPGLFNNYTPVEIDNIYTCTSDDAYTVVTNADGWFYQDAASWINITEDGNELNGGPTILVEHNDGDTFWLIGTNYIDLPKCWEIGTAGYEDFFEDAYIYYAPDSETLTNGTEANDYTAVAIADDTSHDITEEAATPGIELEYEWDAATVPVDEMENVYIRYKYIPDPADVDAVISVQIWDWLENGGAGEWDLIYEIEDTGDVWHWARINNLDSSRYRDGVSGVVIRFIKDSQLGDTDGVLKIDFCCVSPTPDLKAAIVTSCFDRVIFANTNLWGPLSVTFGNGSDDNPREGYRRPDRVALLNQTPGAITAMLPLSRDEFAIYKEDAIIVGTGQASEATFAYTVRVTNCHGPTNPQAVCALPDGTHAFIGSDGHLYIFNGSSIQIATPVIRDVLSNVIPYSTDYFTQIDYNEVNRQLIVWCYGTTNGLWTDLLSAGALVNWPEFAVFPINFTIPSTQTPSAPDGWPRADSTELVVNGNFDDNADGWTLGDDGGEGAGDWHWDGSGEMHHHNSIHHAPLISTSFEAKVGIEYIMSFKISDYSAGNVTLEDGEGNILWDSISYDTDGKKIQYGVADHDGPSNISIHPSNDFDGSINDVTCIESPLWPPHIPPLWPSFARYAFPTIIKYAKTKPVGYGDDWGWAAGFMCTIDPWYDMPVWNNDYYPVPAFGCIFNDPFPYEDSGDDMGPVVWWTTFAPFYDMDKGLSINEIDHIYDVNLYTSYHDADLWGAEWCQETIDYLSNRRWDEGDITDLPFDETGIGIAADSRIFSSHRTPKELGARVTLSGSFVGKVWYYKGSIIGMDQRGKRPIEEGVS